MGVGAGLYMCDVVVKSSRSLSHLLMSSCYSNLRSDIDNDQWTEPARGATSRRSSAARTVYTHSM